jgi:hypothetical protein
MGAGNVAPPWPQPYSEFASMNPETSVRRVSAWYSNLTNGFGVPWWAMAQPPLAATFILWRRT